MASFTVSSGKTVQYDGRLKYGGTGTVYTVIDNYANYQQSLVDISAGNITMSVPFTNNVNLTEQHLDVEVDFSESGNKSIGTHQVFGVTGAVRMKVTAECTSDLVGSANTAVIALGVENATSAWIGGTSAELIDNGEVWCDSTVTETNGNYSTLVLDKVVNGGLDVGYEIATAAMSTGVVVFHCDWTPLNATGVVIAGHLSSMV